MSIEAASGGERCGRPAPDSNAALDQEKEIQSTWRILTPAGAWSSPENYDFGSDDDLRDFVAYDREGSREVAEPPPHIRLMREQEIADYEPASDPGNLRWYPKGNLIKRLLESQAAKVMAGCGAMQVETPIMYDYDHPQLVKYLNRFPARQYLVKSDNKELFLRFAACFGQYMIQHDMLISHNALQFRIPSCSGSSNT